MRVKMTIPERELQRNKLSSIRGNVRNAKKKLDIGLGIAKKTGRIWEWRINDILEDVRALISNLEQEEGKLNEQGSREGHAYDKQ